MPISCCIRPPSCSPGHSDVLLGALVARADDPTYVRRTGRNPPLLRRLSPVRWRPISRCVACGRCRCAWRRRRQARRFWPNGWPGTTASQRVRFPGLPSDPGHDRARRTMSGFGSVISIDLRRREDGRGIRRWLLALGVRHQPRRGRVDLGATAPLAGRTPVGARRSGADVGRDRASRGPLDRPCPGP